MLRWILVSRRSSPASRTRRRTSRTPSASTSPFTSARVGLSRVDEFQQLARGPGLADALARALKEQKASAFFADRTDIEIGADDAVSYADVVRVIDAAAKVGFTDCRLVRLQELSARPTL